MMIFSSPVTEAPIIFESSLRVKDFFFWLTSEFIHSPQKLQHQA
jgi:hypothetical protein